MKIEQTLKLVAVQKPARTNPVVHRREKVLSAINRQMELVKKYQNGEVTRGLWLWTDESGTTFLPIKYGKTPLELSKGKFAIECSSIEEVEDSLESVKTLIRKGALDEVLKTTSETLRAKFLK